MDKITTFSVSKKFGWAGEITARVAKVCRMFGVSSERLRAAPAFAGGRCRIDTAAGDIVYITGPSGAGKSVLLRELESQIAVDEKINLDEIELDENKSVIDCIDGDFIMSLRLLSTAGLGDVFCMLNRPWNLSEGQQYRYKLAIALASGKRYVFADEFCSNLDRITACSISYNIRKFAKRSGTTFFLASAHDDILVDLSPEVIVVCELSGKVEVIYKRSIL